MELLSLSTCTSPLVSTDASVTCRSQGTTLRDAAGNASGAGGVKNGGTEVSSTGLSGVAAFAMSYQLQELTSSSTETSFTYRKDNSLALRASSTTDFHLKTERFTVDLTLTAESLGLTAEDFTDLTQPLKMKISYTQSQLSVSYKASAKTIKSLRPPKEILQDLVIQICDVMKRKGNKSLRYELDAEAIQSLMQSDPEMAKAFFEVLMIMNAINMMKKQGEPDSEYVIRLSGKGNTYTDFQESTRGEMLESSYEFNITILPPGTAMQEASAGGAALSSEGDGT